MNRIYCFLLAVFVLSVSFGQSSLPKTVTSVVLKAPDSVTHSLTDLSRYFNSRFDSDTDRVRAAFVWVATNIRYDVKNMFALNVETDKNAIINNVLQNRMAICEGYAEVFNRLCSLANVPSVIVEGYTKQRGMVDYIPHVWVAAKLKEKWFLFDPTWSSGYIEDGNFVRHFSYRYYQVDPSVLIKTHMPFDYMYQFMDRPLSADDFFAGKSVAASTTSAFNYVDTLQAFQHLSEIDQLKATARRIESNGIRSSMILQMLQYVKNKEQQIVMTNENTKVEKSRQANSKVNAAVKIYNEYVVFKNKQFSPKKTDPEIAHLLDKAEADIETARQLCNDLVFINEENNKLQADFVSHINDLAKSISEEKQFIRKYLNTGKLMRPLLFRSRM